MERIDGRAWLRHIALPVSLLLVLNGWGLSAAHPLWHPSLSERSARVNASQKVIRITNRNLYAKNQGICPPGHPAAGGQAWLFVDEIVIQ